VAVRLLSLMVVAGSFAACSSRQPVARPALPLSSNSSSVVGIASWYGPGFDGHRTSNGDTYNEDDMTAASILFPLGTRLRVTNLNNGRSVLVAVNDHGPYAKGRGIDLSHQAARELGMIGAGTAPVRMDVLYTPPGGPALGQRYFVQVGSFANIANASALAARLSADYAEVEVTEAGIDGDRRYRVRMGAFMNRREAELRAASLARRGYHARIVTE
jgi:rare lipoprotein A